MRQMLALTVLLAAFHSTGLVAGAAGDDRPADVVVYGGTSAGVVAAIQVARMGRTVVLVDPDGRLGGLSSGGLGATDIGNKGAIGGLSREFYRRVAHHYADDDAWRWQEREGYRERRKAEGEDSMWTFEPHVALAIFEDLVREHEIEVWRGERLDRSAGGIAIQDGRIASIRTESGRVASGRVFVDATAEGDLMALAGVSYVVGREAESEFGESLAGVRTELATYHQLVPGVDPFVVPGDPASGLLPGIDPEGPGEEGAGDERVQAYCIRMCLTDHPENRRAVEKPDDYDPRHYELLLRNFDAGADRAPWSPTRMPNRKTDTNNNRGVSTDFIGESYAWAEASYAEREATYARHIAYQKGLLWTLGHHERVPEAIRSEVARWGPPKDEFEANAGWSPQLYVREARRMRSDVVMTEHHCRGTEVVEHSVGLAAYTMDSHHVQRYVDEDGHVRNEGDVQVGVPRPYPIDYGAIRPRRDECTNLLVPCALSATHMAFGSIRMEPVFMVLGQSSGTAACLAVAGDVAVQDVDMEALRTRLLEDGQVLDPARPAPARPGVDPNSLDGLVVDDADAVCVGFMAQSTSVWPWIGRSYRHDGDDSKGKQTAEFRVAVPEPGKYEVLLAYTAHENRATNVPVLVTHTGGAAMATVDQTRAPEGGHFAAIGTWTFEDEASIVITNAGTDGFVVVDGVALRRSR